MFTDLSYLSYPLPEHFARLEAAGDLARAARLIDRWLADPKVPNALKPRLDFEKGIIRELPHSYPLSEEEVFRTLSAALTDFTWQELEEYRDDGTLDWVYIDGQVRYKDNCCDNLLKTRVELKPRRTDKAALAASAAHSQALSDTIARMKKQGGLHLRYRVRATLTIAPEAQEPGKRIRVHMPLPNRDSQCVPGQIQTAPAAKRLAPEDAGQRTAFFEEIYQPGMAFTTEFTYEIKAPYVAARPEEVSPEQPDFYTGELPPHIRFTPYIRALAAELKGEETNPLLVARRFYDYVTTQACYRYVPPYFTKTCIPEYFGAGMRGDCGMHALLFITLCRCAGIPARWQAGWYTPPSGIGNHDWAMFYIAPYGWLYADGSFGGSAYREGNLDQWNFYFGNLEPWRMVSNRDFQQEFDPPRRFLRADPYDNQVGEAEYEDHPLSRHDYQITREILSCEEL